MKIRTFIASAVMALALLVPAAAFAAAPIDDQYGNPTAVAADTATASSPVGRGELPRTGQDIAALVLVGLLLVGSGLALYRASGRRGGSNELDGPA